MKGRLLLLGLSLAVGYWAFREAQQPLPGPIGEHPRPAAELRLLEPQPPAAFQPPALDQLTQLVERPPFSPTRRPPEPPIEQATAQTEPPAQPEPKSLTVPKPDIQVVGIMIDPEKQIALVRIPGVEDLLRLSRGDDMHGWVVDAILPRHIVLRAHDTTAEYALEETARQAPPSAVFEIQQSGAEKMPGIGVSAQSQ